MALFKIKFQLVKLKFAHEKNIKDVVSYKLVIINSITFHQLVVKGTIWIQSRKEDWLNFHDYLKGFKKTANELYWQ